MSSGKFSAAAQGKYDTLSEDAARKALRTLSAANEILVQSASEGELLSRECELLVEEFGHLMAWVGIAEHGVDRQVRPVARYGHDARYLAQAKISWGEDACGQGPTGRAIRTGRVHINPDVLTNPHMVPWREAALERGYRSSVALPLKQDGQVFGALSVYASEPNAFDETAVVLLEELAAKLAFGVSALRAKSGREYIAEQNRHLETRLSRGQSEIAQAVSAAMELCDGHMHGHQRRVAAFSVAIARELELAENRTRGLELAAMLHDIGTIGVPKTILAKFGMLNKTESLLFQQHAQDGRDILKHITFSTPVADIIWQHHERLDGSGYPRGLRGEEILLEARILGVADAVDELASPLLNRPGLGMDAALQAIVKDRGTAFDPAVVDACNRLCRKNRFTFPQKRYAQAE